MKEWRKPYRIVVFASGFRPGKRFKPTKTRGAYSEIVPCDYGFMAWNPTQHYQEARLRHRSLLQSAIFDVFGHSVVVVEK